MIKVGISRKSMPASFLSTLKCVEVWLQCLSWSQKNCLDLNSLVNERIVFSAILCEFYLIIVYDLKAKCTINTFRMFVYDSNHSLLYIPMHCKIKKVLDLVFESFIKMASQSVLLGSLTSRIEGDHAYRSGMKVGDCLFCTIEPDNKHSDNIIAFKSGNDDTVGHVPETLAKKLFDFMKSHQI